MALYAFDGTWNEEHSQAEYGQNTNVLKISRCYEGKSSFYTKGIGTKWGKFGKYCGGFFGAGGKNRLRSARKELAKNFQSGDTTIDIVGFSRGSALALQFANTIHRKGVIEPETKKKLAKRPEIRFVGLWDVVASFGIPINIIIPFQKINIGYSLKIPASVKHCYHALALDERRQTFRPTRLKRGYEVWFRGVHSDVGGGNNNEGLSNIPLKWMIGKGLAAGLPLNRSIIQTLDEGVDPNAAISKNPDLIKNKPRKIGVRDLIHDSVSYRPNHVNGNVDSPRESDG